MKAASSAIRWRTPSARCSTIPDLIVACVVGDGEAETGPLATSWHGNKFLNPATDGAVLPILHLNGYKIANPTVLARIRPRSCEHLLRGYGYAPHLRRGRRSRPEMHQRDGGGDGSRRSTQIRGHPAARARAAATRAAALADDRAAQPEGLDRPEDRGRPEDRRVLARAPGAVHHGKARSTSKLLEEWMRATGRKNCSTEAGRPPRRIAALAPEGTRRMSANPHANGGLLMRPLRMPDFRDYAVEGSKPGRGGRRGHARDGHVSARRDEENADTRNFRVFGPDENNSNRLHAVFEVTDRAWDAATIPEDDHLAPDGRVMEILSEHTCQGWLEGYLLTGRHGLLSTATRRSSTLSIRWSTSTPNG